MHGDMVTTNGVACACFNAPSLAPAFVETCEEDFELADAHMSGELLVSMYGSRLVIQNSRRRYTRLLNDHGCRVIRASSCIMFHTDTHMYLIARGDGYGSSGDAEHLVWLKKVPDTHFEISTVACGPEPENAAEAKIMNMIRTVSDTGYTTETDAYHPEWRVTNLGLQDAKGTTSPITDVSDEGDELLAREKFHRFPPLCARANSLAIDGFALQFSTTAFCRAKLT